MHRGRLLWGLILIAVGGLLFADRLELVDAGAIIAGWWPVAVVAAGGLRLADRPPDRAGAAILATIGLVLLAWRQDVIALDLAWIAPLVLILIGLRLLLRPSRKPFETVAGHRTIDLIAAFTGRELTIAGERFEGGKVTATFGGVELDLRQAVLPPEGATLEVVAVLGGVELRLPAGWDVRVDGPVVLGGIEEKLLPALPGAPVLELRATVVLGGIEVSSDPAVTYRRATAAA